MPTRRDFLLATGSAALTASAMPAVGAPAPDSPKKIRLGVVGGGFGATFHFHEHPNCTVAAVTDLRADRRERLKKHYKCDAVYDSLEEMLPKVEIDALAVYSGALDHCKHVEMAMKRGLHVISACPAVWTLEEAAKLHELKEKTGLKYMMAESSYYRYQTIYARDAFQKGAFGELFYYEVEYYHDSGERIDMEKDKRTRQWEPDGSPSWRYGLPPMHYPTHCLGFVTGVTKERIDSVSCLGWGHKNSEQLKTNRYRNPFWSEAAMMRTTNGHMVRCNVFWCVATTEERAQWFGDAGTLYMSDAGIHGDIWKDLRKKAEPIKIPEYWKSDMLPEAMRHNSGHGGSAVFLSAEFINALVEAREPVIDVYESLAMTVPGIVAHQSALKNGEQMKVPQFEKRG
ncbi:MAG: Gfo/Idh/MocA family protein [Candidatus Udaeobacter sp.]